MFQAILAKRFGRKEKPLPSDDQEPTTLEVIIEPQFNTNNITGLHPKVFGDFRNLRGDVSGLLGEVNPKLHGNATGIIARVDHLKGDISELANRATNRQALEQTF